MEAAGHTLEVYCSTLELVQPPARLHSNGKIRGNSFTESFKRTAAWLVYDVHRFVSFPGETRLERPPFNIPHDTLNISALTPQPAGYRTLPNTR